MKALARGSCRAVWFTAVLAIAAAVVAQTISQSELETADPTDAVLAVSSVAPFVGDHSETWEEFGGANLPNGTLVLGGIATITGTKMVTAGSFQMCTMFAMPSDGTILMYSDRRAGPFIISFSQPVSAFGAYWGSGIDCPDCCFYNDAAT